MKNLKKYLFIALVLLVACTVLAAMAEEPVLLTEEVDLSDKILQEGGINTYRRKLMTAGKSGTDGQEKTLAETIYEGLDSVATAIDVSAYQVTVDQISDAYTKLVNDHPELFYVSGGFGYSHYSSGVVVSMSPSYKIEGVDVDPADIPAMKSAFNAELDRIVNYASKGATPMQKAMLANDYFCTHYCYDTSLEIHNPYTLFTTKTGVCQAYTLGYSAVMNRLGIPVTRAESVEMNHTWNLIKLDGKWYHIDVTWDDPTADRFGRARHEYFLRSDTAFESQLEKPHTNWTTPDSVRASSTAYDNAEWHKMDAPVVIHDGVIYYITAAGKYTWNIRKLQGDAASTIHTYETKWVERIDEKRSIYYQDNFGALGWYNGYLLYTVQDGVYACNPTYGNAFRIYAPESEEGIWASLFRTDAVSMKLGTGLNTFTDTVEWSININNIDDVEELSLDEIYQLEVEQSISVVPSFVPETAKPMLVYTIENPAIAMVDPYTGLLTGVMDGTTTLTVTAENGKFATATVVVGAGTCQHTSESITVRNDDYTETWIIPWDNKQHRVTRVYYADIVCPDCRELLEERVEDGTEVQYVDHVLNADGNGCEICKCDIDISCDHNEETDRTWKYFSEGYKQLDESRHLYVEREVEYECCGQCNCILRLITEDKYEYETPHSFRNDICMECGEKNSCNHQNMRKSGGYWNDYTVKESDITGHTLTGCYVEDYYCEDCKCYISYKTENPVEKREAHYFIDGVCRVCHFVNPCKHENASISYCEFLEYGSYPEIEYMDTGDNFYHVATGTAELTKECPDCGETVWETVENYTGTEKHAYRSEDKCYYCGHINTCMHEHKALHSDYEDHWYMCDDCGWFSGYEDHYVSCGAIDKTVCELCGMSQEEDPDTEIVLKHTEKVLPDIAPTCSEVGYTGKTVCAVCDILIREATEIPTVPHTEERIARVEPTCTEPGHTSGKVCSVCHAVLSGMMEIPATGHQELITYAWHDGQRTVVSHDELVHYVTGVCDLHAECTVCGAERDEINVNITEPVPEAHKFDTDGNCILCGQTCTHHGTRTWKKAEDSENIVCEQWNSEQHLVRRSWQEDWICDDCGKPVGSRLAYNYAEPEFADHIMNEETGCCDFCDFNMKCNHSDYNSNEETYWEPEEYDYVDNKQHIEHAYILSRNRCENCYSVLSTTMSEERYTCPHIFYDGVCECGYSIACEHLNLEHREEWADDVLVEYIDENSHKVIQGTLISYDYCDVCRSRLNIVQTEKQNVMEYHRYNVLDECEYCCAPRKFGGTFGEGLEWWHPDDEHTIVITGNGRMPDFTEENPAPWVVNDWNDVTNIFIGSGVTYVGDYAFAGLKNLRAVDFMQTIMPAFGQKAFANSNVICRYDMSLNWDPAGTSAEASVWAKVPAPALGSRDAVSTIYYRLNGSNETHWFAMDGNNEFPIQPEYLQYLFIGPTYAEVKANRGSFNFDAVMTKEDEAVFRNVAQYAGYISVAATSNSDENMTLDLSNAGTNVNISVCSEGLQLNIICSSQWPADMTVPYGNVVYEGNIRTLTLSGTRNSSEECPEITVNGNVERLVFASDTVSGATEMEGPWTGTLTVNGTVREGTVFGETAMYIPGIGDVPVDQGVGSFSNARGIVIRNGQLMAKMEKTEALTWEMFDYRYELAQGMVRVTLTPNSQSELQDPIALPNILKYNPNFSAEDIIYQDTTSIDFIDDGTYVVRAKDGEHAVCNEIWIGHNAHVDVYADVDWINVTSADAAVVRIYSHVNYLFMGSTARNDLRHTSIYVGERGSFKDAGLNAYGIRTRHFEPVNQPTTIMENGQFKVMSVADDGTLFAILPKADTVGAAVGNLGSDEIAVLDMSEHDGLTEAEQTALENSEMMTENDTVITVVSLDVTKMDEAGARTAITQLTKPVTVTIENPDQKVEADDEYNVIRLHEENGSLTAEQLGSTIGDQNVSIASDKFSTFVLVKVNGAEDLCKHTETREEIIWSDERVVSTDAFNHVISRTKTTHTWCVLCDEYLGETVEYDYKETGAHEFNIGDQCTICGYNKQLEGACGTNMTWRYAAQEHILYISGSGDMDPYGAENPAPWYPVAAQDAKRIILSGDITSVGSYAFANMKETLVIDFAPDMTIPPIIDETTFTGTTAYVRYYTENDAWAQMGQYGGQLTWIYFPYWDPYGTLSNITFGTNPGEKEPAWFILPSGVSEYYVLSKDQIASMMIASNQFSPIVQMNEYPEKTEDIQSLQTIAPYAGQIIVGNELSNNKELNLQSATKLYSLTVRDIGHEAQLQIKLPDGDTGKIDLFVEGNVNAIVDGNIKNLRLNGCDASSSLMINGNIEEMDWWRSVTESDVNYRPWKGTLTVAGTLVKGNVHGTGTIDIPGIGDNIPFGGSDGTIERQTGLIVQEGTLMVPSTSGELTGLTIDDLILRYDLYEGLEGEKSGWELMLYKKDRTILSTIKIINYNPEFITADILDGPNTEVVWGDPMITEFGLDKDGNKQTFSVVDATMLEASGNGKNFHLACDVQNLYLPVNGAGFTISGEVNSVQLADYNSFSKKQTATIMLEEGGKIVQLQLHTFGSKDRYAYSINGPVTIMDNGQMKIMSQGNGENLSAILPNTTTVTNAADLADGEFAVLEMDQKSEELTLTESDALEEAIRSGRISDGKIVAAVDLSVTKYDENASKSGNLTQLDNPIEVKLACPVSAESADSFEAIRLHDDGTGFMVAERVGNSEGASDISISTNRFSTYVIMETIPTYRVSVENAWIGENEGCTEQYVRTGTELVITACVPEGKVLTGWQINEVSVAAGTSLSTTITVSNENVDVKPVLAQVISVPTAIGNLEYNATEQNGISEGTGYTLTGHKGITAGTYTATASLTDGYAWADAPHTGDRTIQWSIAKVAALEAPTGLTGVATSCIGGTDGKISGTTAAMEYSADGENYRDCTDTETNGLTAGTYLVRYKVEDLANFEAGITAEVVVPEHVHSFVIEDEKAEGALKSEADCENAAIYYKSCACGAISDSDTDTFSVGDPKGHTLKFVDETPNCIQDGMKAHQVCEACEKLFTMEGEPAEEADLIIPKGDHDWQEEERIEPTCTTTGKVTSVCKKCELVKTEVLEKLNHDFSIRLEGEENVVAPTCETDGYHMMKCKWCEATQRVTDEDEEATGHEYGYGLTEYTTHHDATCTEGGYDEVRCIHENCTSTITANLTDALGHDFENEGCQVKEHHPEATLTKGGYDVIQCIRCEEITEVEMSEAGAKWGDLTCVLKDGMLTISGNGNMPEINTEETPWVKENCTDQIVSVVIEFGVSNIASSTFDGCINLTSVKMASTVSSIGASAFNNCSKLNSVEIPDSVNTIGEKAFNGCSALKEIELGEAVISIGSNAFDGCNDLTVTTVQGTAAYEYAKANGLQINDVTPATPTPTVKPTATPTATPTAEPTAVPTAAPTAEPTAAPTAAPTPVPTAVPTAVPTPEPTPVTLQSAMLNKTEATLYARKDKKRRDTLQLEILSLTPAGVVQETVWQSSNAGVATVNADGLVTAVKAGSADITLIAQGTGTELAKCTVTVKKDSKSKLKSLKAKKKKITITMKKGKTAEVVLIFKPATVFDNRIKWTTSDKKIATVKNGVITAKKKGKCVITATSQANKKISVKITVTVK